MDVWEVNMAIANNGPYSKPKSLKELILGPLDDIDNDILEHIEQKEVTHITDYDIERLTSRTKDFRYIIEIKVGKDLTMYSISGLDHAKFSSVESAYSYAKEHRIPLINKKFITTEPRQAFEYLYGLVGGSLLTDKEGNYTNKVTSILYIGYLMGLDYPTPS